MHQVRETKIAENQIRLSYGDEYVDIYTDDPIQYVYRTVFKEIGLVKSIKELELRVSLTLASAVANKIVDLTNHE